MTEERLYIEDLQKELHYRDRRSVRRWCRNNNVRILSDIGSNKQFVLKEEFERQKSKSYAVKFSKKNFTRTYHTYINKVRKGSGYQPKGEYEKEALSRFTNLWRLSYDAPDGE